MSARGRDAQGNVQDGSGGEAPIVLSQWSRTDRAILCDKTQEALPPRTTGE